MEPNSRKNDDCYFYYYSTCLKGENCLFRHEENALGCEVVCQYWKEGKCLNERCNFRHMELKKNRKVIPCYWETQPSGCRKPHCPFRHMNQQKDKPPDKSKDGNVSNSNIVMSGGVLNVPGSTAGRNPSTDGSVPGPTVVRGDINYSANPVDPIVVKFEEESDNESVQSSSPCKSTLPLSACRRNPSSPSRVKTLEEIRLERIQQQSAAFYDFGDMECDVNEPDYEFPGNFNLSRRVSVSSKANLFDGERKDRSYSDFKVLTLDEIRKNRQKKTASFVKGNNSDGEFDITVRDMNSDEGDERHSQYKEIRNVNFKSSVLPDSTSEAESNYSVTNNEKHFIPLRKDSSDLFSRRDDGEHESPLKNSDECVDFAKTNDNSRVNIVNSDAYINNEYCNNYETVPHYKQKPIKLRRFVKRSFNDEDNANDHNVRRKLKRFKLNLNDKDAICSSSNTEINNMGYNSMDQEIIESNDNSFTSTESRLTASHVAGDRITDINHGKIKLKLMKVNKDMHSHFDKKNNIGWKEYSEANDYRMDDSTELWLTSSPIRDDDPNDDATLNILKDIDDLLND